VAVDAAFGCFLCVFGEGVVPDEISGGVVRPVDVVVEFGEAFVDIACWVEVVNVVRGQAIC